MQVGLNSFWVGSIAACTALISDHLFLGWPRLGLITTSSPLLLFIAEAFRARVMRGLFLAWVFSEPVYSSSPSPSPVRHETHRLFHGGGITTLTVLGTISACTVLVTPIVGLSIWWRVIRLF